MVDFFLIFLFYFIFNIIYKQVLEFLEIQLHETYEFNHSKYFFLWRGETLLCEARINFGYRTPPTSTMYRLSWPVLIPSKILDYLTR